MLLEIGNNVVFTGINRTEIKEEKNPACGFFSSSKFFVKMRLSFIIHSPVLYSLFRNDGTLRG